MLFGGSSDEDDGRVKNLTRAAHGPGLPILLALGTTAVLGFASGSFATLLTDAAAVLGGA